MDPSRWSAVSSIWPSYPIGSVVVCCRDGCRLQWRRHSASNPGGCSGSSRQARHPQYDKLHENAFSTLSRAAERGDDRHWPSAPTALSIVDFGAAGELFKLMVGIDLTHVPYRREAPALTDLLGGQVQILFGTLPTSIEYIRTGKLRALAVTTATRSHALPDVPTVSDFFARLRGEFLAGRDAMPRRRGAPRRGGRPAAEVCAAIEITSMRLSVAQNVRLKRRLRDYRKNA